MNLAKILTKRHGKTNRQASLSLKINGITFLLTIITNFRTVVENLAKKITGTKNKNN